MSWQRGSQVLDGSQHRQHLADRVDAAPGGAAVTGAALGHDFQFHPAAMAEKQIEAGGFRTEHQVKPQLVLRQGLLAQMPDAQHFGRFFLDHAAKDDVAFVRDAGLPQQCPGVNLRRQAALDVAGRPAVQVAACHDATKRRVLPQRFVAGVHMVHVRVEHQVGAAAAAAQHADHIADRVDEHFVVTELTHPGGAQSCQRFFLAAGAGRADQLAGKIEHFIEKLLAGF
jgi:hypothetical protein